MSADVRKQYVGRVAERLKAGDCFEVAMRRAYRAALCSPDFLYHVEPAGELDDHALACRLSYFVWNSMPDEKLSALATAGKLRRPGVLKAEMNRLLADPRSRRFVEDFLGQRCARCGADNVYLTVTPDAQGMSLYTCSDTNWCDSVLAVSGGQSA